MLSTLVKQKKLAKLLVNVEKSYTLQNVQKRSIQSYPRRIDNPGFLNVLSNMHEDPRYYLDINPFETEEGQYGHYFNHIGLVVNLFTL
jgi:hypothetical protein